MPLIITNPAQQPIDSAGEIPSGTVFPTSPTIGDMFLFTPFSSVYQYSGSAWINIQSFAAFTMYVDSTGTDANGKGTGTGTDAFATLGYAFSNLPFNYGANVTIVIGSGSFNFPATVAGRNTNGYITYVNGNLTEELASSTTTTFRENLVTGGGQVQTTGVSATVDVIAGGDTTNLCVGAIVIANSLRRYVTAINSSTQFTVNETVDWSVGYAWQYNNLGTIADTNVVFSDDQYNGKLLVSNTGGSSDPLTWVPGSSRVLWYIKDTHATGSRLELGGSIPYYLTSFAYKIYTLNTTLLQSASNTEIGLDRLVFRCIKLTRNSFSGINVRSIAAGFIGCEITDMRVMTFFSCSAFFLGCLTKQSLSGFNIYQFVNSAVVGSVNADNLVGGEVFFQLCYFAPLTGADSAILVHGTTLLLNNCIFDCSTSQAPVRARNFGSVEVSTILGTNAIRRVSGYSTAGIEILLTSIGMNLTASAGAFGGGVYIVGFASPYTASAAQMSYVT